MPTIASCSACIASATSLRSSSASAMPSSTPEARSTSFSCCLSTRPPTATPIATPPSTASPISPKRSVEAWLDSGGRHRPVCVRREDKRVLASPFDDRPSRLKAKAGITYTGLITANLGAWLWAWLAFADRPALFGTAFLAYVFGLRHAFDADHISAIDNVVRKLMQEG